MAHGVANAGAAGTPHPHWNVTQTAAGTRGPNNDLALTAAIDGELGQPAQAGAPAVALNVGLGIGQPVVRAVHSMHFRDVERAITVGTSHGVLSPGVVGLQMPVLDCSCEPRTTGGTCFSRTWAGQ